MLNVVNSCIHSEDNITWTVMLMSCGHIIGRKIAFDRRTPIKKAKCEYCNEDTKTISKNSSYNSQLPIFMRDPVTGKQAIRTMKLEFSRNLIISMFFIESLGYYSMEEIIDMKDVQFMASRIRKVNFTIRNGPASELNWIDQKAVQKMLKGKSAQKMGEIIQKSTAAIRRKERRIQYWNHHRNAATAIWKSMEAHTTGDVHITINHLLLSILRKEPKMIKKYGFKDKFIKSFGLVSDGETAHFMSSGRVATRMLKELDELMAREPLIIELTD